MEQAPCPGCGATVEFEPVFSVGNKTWAPYCATCKAEQEREFQREARDAAIANHWARVCPPTFRDTEFELLPCRDKSSEAINWTFDQGRGLNLWGLHGTGKTRTMYLILKTLHAAGKSMSIFSPTRFVKELEERSYHRASWIDSLARKDFVCFDDMDKLSLTGPMEKSFFGLLDQRMTHGKPCIFTHNSKATELEWKFKMGGSLVRRIREFTKSIHFGKL